MAGQIKSEDKQRKQLISTTIVLGSIVLLFGLTCTITYNAFTQDNFDNKLVFVIPSLLILHFVFLLLIKKGYVNTVCLLLLTIYLSGTLFGAYTWGLSMPMTLLMFSLIINISSILLGSKCSITITAIIFISMIILGIREVNNPEIASWKNNSININDVLAYVFILFASTGLTTIYQNEIKKSLERARDSEKSLREISQVAEFGKIAKGLFHDLISPLSSISLYIESVKENPRKAKEAHEYINKAIKVSERMRTMIQAIKNNTRSSNLIQRFSILDEINTAKDLLEKKAYGNGIDIDISKLKKYYIIGNPLRFHQVVYNLISNSIDALETVDGKEKKIEIMSWQKDSVLNIEVTDNGQGIPNYYIGKIFEPSFTTKKDHFGIGLSTAYEIVENEFNGKLSVTSKVGFGTTFIISIPIYENQSKITYTEN